jgi:hypothetical protein
MTVMMMPFCEAQAPTRHKRQEGTSTSYSKYGVFQQIFKKGSVRALFVSLSEAMPLFALTICLEQAWP